MEYVTYKDIVALHGSRPAFNMLLTLERLARIGDEMASIDLDARFDKALHALSDTDFAS